MGNKKGSSYREFELSGDEIPADTPYQMYSHVEQLTYFVYWNTRKLKKLTQRTIRHFKTTMLLNCSKTRLELSRGKL